MYRFFSQSFAFSAPPSASRRPVFALPLLTVLAFFAGSVAAAPPGDPTEAPAVWVATQPGAPGVEAASAQAMPKIQMVLKGQSRKLVVIDGEVVKVGDQYQGTKVVAITADKVLMEDASKSLQVTPDVKKTAPMVAKVKKKAVVIPADSVRSSAQ